jgi:hypothetical protein
VRTYTDNSGCCGAQWLASGTGSRLNFPALTNLTGNPTWAMLAQASAGGRVELTNLAYIASSAITLKATGTNSVVNLPALTAYQGTAGALTLDAGSGGAITCSNLTTGTRVAVIRRAGGRLPLTQFRGLTLGAVTLEDGAAVTLSAVTNVDGAAFAIKSGSSLTLPAVASFADTSGCCGVTWEANGAGSLLSMPGLTTFSGNPTWDMKINALAGGQVVLSSVPAVLPSVATVTADGTNSVVNLSSLTTVSGASGHFNLEAKNGGTILAPNLVDGQRAGLTLRTSGTITAPLVSRLLGLTVDGAVVILPGVTNLTSAGTLTLMNAGSATLSGVTNMDGQSLSVSGGSTLALPGVRT